MVKKRIEAYSKEKIKELHGIAKFLYNRPILKFIILVIIQFILINSSNLFPTNFPIRIIMDITGILISIYFVLVIIYIIRNSVERLSNPKNLYSLIFTYALFLLGIILLFSTLYSVIEVAKLGYIKYGVCEERFDSSMISSDPTVSRDFFYFSAVTFFTVGYGDICPMGLAKMLSILVAFTGHLISVVIVAIIINNYIQKREFEKKYIIKTIP